MQCLWKLLVEGRRQINDSMLRTIRKPFVAMVIQFKHNHQEQLQDKGQFILYATEDIDAEKVIEEIERYCPQIDSCGILRESRYAAAYLLSGEQ